MKELWKQTEKLIRDGNIEKCLQLLGPLPEKDRRSIFPKLQAAGNKVQHIYFNDNEIVYTKQQAEAISACVLLVFNTSDLVSWGCAPCRVFSDDFLISVMKKYPRKQFSSYADYLLKHDMGRNSLIQRMIQEGICERPDSEEYYRRLFNGYCFKGPIYDHLKHDPSFLENELWSMLKVEGSGQDSFAAAQKYVADWTGALVRLTREGQIPRDKFITALFDAIERDFAAFRGQWFTNTLRELQLTADEKTIYQKRYFTLLGSSIPQTVSFALKEVAQIHKVSPIAPAELAPLLSPLMLAKQKGVLTAAIRLLTDALKKDPSLRMDILQCLAQGFLHESPDIQEKLIKLLEREEKNLTENELENLITPYASSIAPALQSRIQKWTHIPGSQNEDAEWTSQQRKPQPVQQIQSIEELSEKAAEQFENPDDPILFEQVLDGFSRMGTIALTQHAPLFEPLKTRIKKHFKTYIYSRKNRSHMDLFYAGLFNMDVDVQRETNTTDSTDSWQFMETNNREGQERSTPEYFYKKRLQTLAQSITAGTTNPLLSFPSLENGEISANDLLDRLNATSGTLNKTDFIQALLRLNCHQSESGLHLPTIITGDKKTALKFALGQSEQLPKDPELRMAAFLAAGKPVNETWVPWNGDKPEYAWKETQSEYGYSMSIWLSNEQGSADQHFYSNYLHFACTKTSAENCTQWHPKWMTIFYPKGSETLYAYGADWADCILESAEVYNLPVMDLLPLLIFSTTEFGPMAALFTVMMAASADAASRQLASDVIIALINDGRMNTDLLGEQMSRLLPSKRIICGRWHKSFGDIILISKRHASTLVDIIQNSLRGDIADAPRDMAKYLDILRQAMAITGRTDLQPDVVEYFANNKRGGQVKKIIAELTK